MIIASNVDVNLRSTDRGMSSPLTVIIVSIVLISITSQLALSSLTALDSVSASQLEWSTCALIHNEIESLCLRDSPSTIDIIVISKMQAISISGNTISCEGVDFAWVADPADIILSSGCGFLVYDPDKIKFVSDCTIIGAVNLRISLRFEGGSERYLLEAIAV